MSKNTGTSELINYFDLGANGDVGIAGSLDINTIANATTDTDTFLVSDTGIIKYRTGAQLLSDIGGQAAGNYVTTDTSQAITANKSFTVGFSLGSEGSGNQTSFFRNTSSIFSGSGGSNIFGFNNSNNIYFGKGLNNGGVLQWNNTTATRYYTLPDADGTLALTSQIPANAVGGTGAFGRVAYWNAAGTITSDSLFQWNDTFRRLGIGCTPTVSLDVVGAGVFSSSLTSDSLIISNNDSRIRNNDATGRIILSNSSTNTFAIFYGTSHPTQANQTVFANGGVTTCTFFPTGAATFTSSVTAASLNVRGSSPQVQIGISGGNYIELTDNQLSAKTSAGAASNLFLNVSGANTILNRDSGNVGIGTSSPSERLEILGPDGSGAAVRWRMAGGRKSGYLYSDSAGVAIYDTNLNDAGIYLAQNSQIDFRVSGSQRMIITSGGNVGIGTISPATTLEVLGANVSEYLRVGGGTISARSLTFSSFDVSGLSGVGHRLNVQNANGVLAFDIAGTERMRIASGGNVGIGTTFPEHKLDVRSPSGNNIIRSNVTITSDGQQAILATSAIWSGAERGVSFSIYKHSAITNPASYVSFFGGGSAFRYMFIDDSGVLRLSESSSDIGTYGGTVVGTQTSDIRLKNVKDEFNYGLKEILQINPIAFTFKKDENQVEKLGFAAQEIINIIPESVYDTGNCIDGYEDTDDPMLKIAKSNDTILAMDYSMIIPVLVKAIQEQQIQIDKLKNS